MYVWSWLAVDEGKAPADCHSLWACFIEFRSSWPKADQYALVWLDTHAWSLILSLLPHISVLLRKTCVTRKQMAWALFLWSLFHDIANILCIYSMLLRYHQHPTKHTVNILCSSLPVLCFLLFDHYSHSAISHPCKVSTPDGLGLSSVPFKLSKCNEKLVPVFCYSC